MATDSARLVLLRVLRATTRDVIAATCRVSASTVSRWASGDTSPRKAHRGLLERFGVPVEGAW